MRIASITLPKTDNNGMPVKKAHEYLRNAIMEKFLGVTIVDVKGMWKNADGVTFVDDSFRYEFACGDTLDTKAFIVMNAKQAGLYAGQEAMFVVYPDGEADII